MMIWLRIGGVPATEIAPHTPPTYETLAEGGSGEASWAFALSARSQHPALQNGALVEILCGGAPVYRGVLDEPDRSTWQCTAHGVASTANNYLALNTDGGATRDLLAASSRARTVGWAALANAPAILATGPGPSPGTETLSSLFNDAAEQAGQRWGVDAFGVPYFRTDPTSPSWLATPDAAAFGTTSEGQATRLIATFLRPDGLIGVEPRGVAGLEATIDLTERGALTYAQVDSILDGILARGKASPKWVNGVTLSREQLTTMGGTPAHLASVIAGTMMRAHGLPYAVARAPYLDVVIGKTRYTAGDDVIYLEPVNTAPRNLTDAIAAA